ncbi:hypothetical protein A9404_03525 [Halothiobacillus diazotrophicus]|uniref:DUF1418 domain-containing protein n=1 Tax=Halothiobacillus diazotrophicus TaxID=1860122 RepID=A0A191ZFC9_9GAMM|nr:hypothetical protein [Halothiobacillus diazotrophicus]ANJ66573.1 hypothetical protein A9404_03525 [Halothiobacillus diazotrophicus]
MNTPPRHLPFPIWVILLDFLGTGLFALGAYLLYHPETTVVPANFRFAFDGPAWMAIGFLLTLPLILQIVRIAKTANQRQDADKHERSEPTVQ